MKNLIEENTFLVYNNLKREEFPYHKIMKKTIGSEPKEDCGKDWEVWQKKTLLKRLWKL